MNNYSIQQICYLFNIDNCYENKNEFIYGFIKLISIDITDALSFIIYLRNFKHGKGDRNMSLILTFLIKIINPQIYNSFLKVLVNHGCWKDILKLCTFTIDIGDNNNLESEIDLFCNQLTNDLVELKKNPNYTISTAAKWAPSEKSIFNRPPYNLAFIFMNKLGLSERLYRKNISFLRNKLNLVESNLSQDTTRNINFENLPYMSFKKYFGVFGKYYKSSSYDINFDRLLLKSKFKEYSLNINQTHKNFKISDKIMKMIFYKNNSINLNYILTNLLITKTFNRSTVIINDTNDLSINSRITMIMANLIALSNKNNYLFQNKIFTSNSHIDTYFDTENNNIDNNFNEVIKNDKLDIINPTTNILNLIINNNIPLTEIPEEIIIFSQNDCIKDNILKNIKYVEKLYNKYNIIMPRLVVWILKPTYSKYPCHFIDSKNILIDGFSKHILNTVLKHGFSYLNRYTKSESILLNYRKYVSDININQRSINCDITKVVGELSKINNKSLFA